MILFATKTHNISTEQFDEDVQSCCMYSPRRHLSYRNKWYYFLQTFSGFFPTLKNKDTVFFISSSNPSVAFCLSRKWILYSGNPNVQTKPTLFFKNLWETLKFESVNYVRQAETVQLGRGLNVCAHKMIKLAGEKFAENGYYSLLHKKETDLSLNCTNIQTWVFWFRCSKLRLSIVKVISHPNRFWTTTRWVVQLSKETKDNLTKTTSVH